MKQFAQAPWEVKAGSRRELRVAWLQSKQFLQLFVCFCFFECLCIYLCGVLVVAHMTFNILCSMQDLFFFLLLQLPHMIFS